jgi:AcrR family transcriptional regulator
MYRHFPTRQELLVAVYSDEVTALCEQGEALLAAAAPGDALFDWLRAFIAHVATKTGAGAGARRRRSRPTVGTVRPLARGDALGRVRVAEPRATIPYGPSRDRGGGPPWRAASPSPARTPTRSTAWYGLLRLGTDTTASGATKRPVMI